jgi:hypothetical protein
MLGGRGPFPGSYPRYGAVNPKPLGGQHSDVLTSPTTGKTFRPLTPHWSGRERHWRGIGDLALGPRWDGGQARHIRQLHHPVG